jgi:hypothetical protein
VREEKDCFQIMDNEFQDERSLTRKCIFGLINLIASKEEQIRYQEDVPNASVPNELVCMWFDDHYPIGKKWFDRFFSKTEKEKIIEFSNFYEERIQLLPKTSLIENFHESEIWEEIVNKAKETAKELGTENFHYYG